MPFHSLHPDATQAAQTRAGMLTQVRATAGEAASLAGNVLNGRLRPNTVREPERQSLATYGPLEVIASESEFEVVDAVTLLQAAIAKLIIGSARARRFPQLPIEKKLPGGPHFEMDPSCVEYSPDGPVHLNALQSVALANRRLAARDAAHARGLVIGVGLPLAGAGFKGITDDSRYTDMGNERGAALIDRQDRGAHFHVSDPDEHLRFLTMQEMIPFLPMLYAMTTNSSVHNGKFTGWHGYRYWDWQQNLTVGVPGLVKTEEAEKERLRQKAIAAGADGTDLTVVHEWLRYLTNLDSFETRISDGLPTSQDDFVMGGIVSSVYSIARARALAKTTGLLSSLPQTKKTMRSFPNVKDVEKDLMAVAQVGRYAMITSPFTGERIPAFELVNQLFMERKGSTRSPEFGAGRAHLEEKGVLKQFLPQFEAINGLPGRPGMGRGTGSERTIREYQLVHDDLLQRNLSPTPMEAALSGLRLLSKAELAWMTVSAATRNVMADSLSTEGLARSREFVAGVMGDWIDTDQSASAGAKAERRFLDRIKQGNVTMEDMVRMQEDLREPLQDLYIPERLTSLVRLEMGPRQLTDSLEVPFDRNGLSPG